MVLTKAKDYLHQQYLSIYELIGFQLKLGFLLMFSISKFVRPFTVTEANLSLVTFCYGILVLFKPFQSSPQTVELALKKQHSMFQILEILVHHWFGVALSC